MLGLIIKSPWDDLILLGHKTWELRSRNTKIRGRIAIIRSGSGKIMGYADVVDSFPISRQKLLNSIGKHRVGFRESLDHLAHISATKKKTYAWVLRNPKKLKRPKKYKHHNGAVIWVKI